MYCARAFPGCQIDFWSKPVVTCAASWRLEPQQRMFDLARYLLPYPETMMDPAEIARIFEETGALLTGHFLLTSGLHSEKYLQCAKVLQWPHHAEACAQGVGRSTLPQRIPELVISPAIGGIVIGQEVGRALGCRAIFAERESGALRLRRGFSIEPGELRSLSRMSSPQEVQLWKRWRSSSRTAGRYWVPFLSLIAAVAKPRWVPVTTASGLSTFPPSRLSPVHSARAGSSPVKPGSRCSAGTRAAKAL